MVATTKHLVLLLLLSFYLRGFARVNHGEGKGGYKHFLFQQGEPELCQQMMRGQLPDMPGNRSYLYLSPEPSRLNQLHWSDDDSHVPASSLPAEPGDLGNHNMERITPSLRRLSQFALSQDQFLSEGTMYFWKVSSSHNERDSRLNRYFFLSTVT